MFESVYRFIFLRTLGPYIEIVNQFFFRNISHRPVYKFFLKMYI
jgi:hypothetical protein